jgi:hypothetical protein
MTNKQAKISLFDDRKPENWPTLFENHLIREAKNTEQRRHPRLQSCGWDKNQK